MNPDAFASDPWGQLSGCIENVKLGLQELRGMQKNVEQMTKRQLAAQTLRENLAILYDEFSEAIGHTCYRELVRVRLPIRVRQARRCLEQIELDEVLHDKMVREVMRRRPADDQAAASSYTRNRIHELFQLLDAIEPQAEPNRPAHSGLCPAFVCPVSLSAGSAKRATGTGAVAI